jgi:nucleoside-diphosphate-sugar epimerase
MRVLITGASGFVGQHAVRSFTKAGWQVHGVARGACPDALACAWHAGDVLDAGFREALVERVAPSHLVHLAWTTQHGQFWSDERNADWCDASLALLQAFARRGGQHAFIAGSCAEDMTRMPPTRYGQAKAALRDTALRHAEAVGVALTWGRIYFPYGPGERAQRLIPSLIERFLRDESAATGPSHFVRDFVHVEDVAAMIRLVGERCHHGVVDLCSGAGSRVGDVARAIAQRVGRPELLREGQLPAREGDPATIVGNLAALRSLGWAPRHDLAQGLDSCVQWWREQLALEGATP